VLRSLAALLLPWALVASAAAAEPPAQPAADGSEAAGAGAADDDGEAWPALLDRLPFRAYGRVVLDGSWDSSRTDPGNFARWVEPDGEGDDELNLSANPTRLGLVVEGPEGARLRTRGRVEMDFVGGGGENAPRARLRRAEAWLLWPELDLGIGAGQTWDLVAPLFPEQLNFSVGWFAGNIGFRRPQIQLRKGFDLGGRSRLLLAVAASRTIGDPLFDEDVGGDAGFPTGQARVALTLPGWAGPVTVGLSGHGGEQECDSAGGDFTTWSAVADLRWPLASWLQLTGEVWRGQAVCTFLGGIGQGINPVRERAIDAHGFWASLRVDPAPGWRVVAGLGRDDPRDAALEDGQRSRNSHVFANAVWTFLGRLSLGVEGMWLRTAYKNRENASTWRVMTQLRLDFGDARLRGVP